MLNYYCRALLIVEPTGGSKTALIQMLAILVGARTIIVVTLFTALCN
jgi:hypothetical protein